MIRSFLGKYLARRGEKRIRKWSSKPAEVQNRIFHTLLEKGQHTAFGKKHGLGSVKTYEDFKKAVPIRDYEEYKSWLDRAMTGEKDVVWPGKPLYFAKTSGTTSGGAKYIPITKDSVPNHINSARNALYCYINQTGNTDFIRRKLMFLSGSARLNSMNGIATGRLSGIVNHHIPFYLKINQLPSFKTNCIEDWEEKLGKIIDETYNRDLGLISGIPPWVQMYFDRLHAKTGKKIKDIFPHLSVFVHGGVNFGPYGEKLTHIMGKELDTVETYPASEGFIAFQDKFPSEGLLMILNDGIFFEFIPLTEFHHPDPPRLRIEETKENVNYVVIVNNNAGLWGYNLGDTVRFVSRNPYRVVVTGRVKQFISAFGEHVIIEEVEQSMAEVSRKMGVNFREFTVAPLVSPPSGLPRHQWFIEFEKVPENLESFRINLDQALRDKNIYYNELVESRILEPLHIIALRKGGFNEYLHSTGQIGGQYKVPRLRNNRDVADQICRYIDKDHQVNKQFLKDHVGNL